MRRLVTGASVVASRSQRDRAGWLTPTSWLNLFALGPLGISMRCTSFSHRIQDSRSAAAAGEVLRDYGGTIPCDGHSAYESLKKRGGKFEHAHCWAHVRRKFVEAEEFAPEPSKQVLDLISELYAVERECTTDQDSARARADRSRELLKRIHTWALEQRALPQSPLGKAIRYMGDLWPGLVRFTDEPRLALDNALTVCRTRCPDGARRGPTDGSPQVHAYALRVAGPQRGHIGCSMA